MKLKDRIAVVTGAGSGLGRGIATALAHAGAKLVINDLRKEAAAAVCDVLVGDGCDAMAVAADVSDSVEVAAMFEEIVARFGTVDILVNNAGMVLIADPVRARMDANALALASGKRQEPLGATRSMTDSQWRRTLSVHLDGTFLCTREALRIMEPKGAGKIINIASVAGQIGLGGSPDYSAAKAGIIGFTKAVAREVIASGVYVNAIAPGFIDTPLLESLPSIAKRLISFQVPIGRLGTVDEVVAVAMFLAGDESSYLVGQVISPNGGISL